MMRLDPEVWPTKQKCATVSSQELHQLRTITNVLRHGRVAALHEDKIEFLDGSTVPSLANTLYVDCTSDGLATTPSVPIFQGSKLVLQPVSMCQQVASAAMIAALELQPGDDERKNNVLVPIPHPNYPRDLFAGYLATNQNTDRMIKDGAGWLWVRRSRLTYEHHLSWRCLVTAMVKLWKVKSVVEENLAMFGSEGCRDCRKVTD